MGEKHKGKPVKEIDVNPKFAVTDERTLRSLFQPTGKIAIQKCQTQLDKHSIAFIKRSPFVCIGTQDADGKADVSPRGDPVGFVQVLDQRTLAIPDRPGNNRLDTLSNIISNPVLGFCSSSRALTTQCGSMDRPA